MVNIWSTWSRDFFWKRVLVFKLHSPFTKFIKSNLHIHSLRGEWHFKWGIAHQKIFQENSYGYLHDDVYRIYSSKTIHNVSFQLISCQKICKKYESTSNRELHMQILQTLSVGVKNVSIEPLIRAWKFSLKIPSQFEDINNMLTELAQSGMHRGTTIELLQLGKSLWEIKGAFVKISKFPYFTSNHKLLMRFSMHKIK